MSQSSTEQVIQTYVDGHAKILGYLRKLSDTQLQSRPSNGTATEYRVARSIAWADHLQGGGSGMTPELSRRLPPVPKSSGIRAYSVGVLIWPVESGNER